ncbi:hypothetical protein R3P38DRAFT_3239573 [Favolaschia claudopus]|uniref:GH16 domain-containing protein n=1 Tax=Favolaschia claudopus TaxID=2862362 RepID=A0AAV9Z7N1_9AGAR
MHSWSSFAKVVHRICALGDTSTIANLEALPPSLFANNSPSAAGSPPSSNDVKTQPYRFLSGVMDEATKKGLAYVQKDSTTVLAVNNILAMPHGPSVWPAYWTVGPNWPNSAEIDIIEGVGDSTTNQMTLYTSQRLLFLLFHFPTTTLTQITPTRRRQFTLCDRLPVLHLSPRRSLKHSLAFHSNLIDNSPLKATSNLYVTSPPQPHGPKTISADRTHTAVLSIFTSRTADADERGSEYDGIVTQNAALDNNKPSKSTRTVYHHPPHLSNAANHERGSPPQSPSVYTRYLAASSKKHRLLSARPFAQATRPSPAHIFHTLRHPSPLPSIHSRAHLRPPPQSPEKTY